MHCAGMQAQYPAVNIPALGLTVPGGLPAVQTQGLASHLQINQVCQDPPSCKRMLHTVL